MISIIEMLEKTAGAFPDRTAFSDPDESITFKELLTEVQRTAALFIKGTAQVCVRPEAAVGFYLEKSVRAVPVMLGAVSAGGFYSFIDIRQPSERVLKILEILEPAAIITDEENYDNLMTILSEGTGSGAQNRHDHFVSGPDKASDRCVSPGEYKKRVLLLSEISKLAEAAEADEALIDQRRRLFYDQMPLYVNFTSGSTGVPKGVAVGHRSVIDFITEFTKVFEIGPDDILANQAPFDFDVSVKDIYSGLYTGAEVRLIPRQYFSEPARLMDYLTDNRVTVLIWAVSAMCFVSIMNGFEYKTPVTVKKVMFSGELMPVKQLDKWRKSLPGALFVNLYGPTEITCNCTYYILDREFGRDEIIPTGIPFRNEKVFLLDENDREVTEQDTEGEICVGGTTLALGYYKDPERTAEVFVQNPLNNRFTERIYRTGDLGRYDKDGNLVYTSRKDFQIKHMGQRIELSDIDVSAMSIDGVSRAVSIYDMKKKKIILFYTGDLEREELSQRLKEKLPPFMLPSKTVVINEMPLNKNGKIDRKALEEMI
ncbi:MAG TPA: D-alanine--poly(phosphoribitol) ligase [Lachnospiraceae bacterium]|nr:D-alanine--poly(phosphoribitol) ligase [Lachnospiraceae bacterium]